MSHIEIGDPDEIRCAAEKFANAASAPAGAAAQVARRLILAGGQPRSEVDDSMAGGLRWIVETLDAAARSRMARAGAISAAAVDVVDAIVAADEAGAERTRRALPG